MTRADIRVGDIVEVNCPALLGNLRHTSTIVGKVLAVFDALNPDGSEGNLEIDIRPGVSGWIRYKPLKDGGTIRVIERGKNG